MSQINLIIGANLHCLTIPLGTMAKLLCNKSGQESRETKIHSALCEIGLSALKGSRLCAKFKIQINL